MAAMEIAEKTIPVLVELNPPTCDNHKDKNILHAAQTKKYSKKKHPNSQ